MCRFGFRLTALTIALLLFGSTKAHHSSNGVYDSDRTITIQGSVTRFDWKNPHLYVFVEAINEDGDVVNWRIEGRPLAFMRRIGWSRDTLIPGDKVTVTVNLPLDLAKARGLLRSIEVDGREIPPISGESVGKLMTTNSREAKSGADSLSGTWITLVNGEILGIVNDPTKHNLTEAGLKAVESFDQSTMHPGLECIPFTAPVLMVVPDTKSIVLNDDIGRIRGDFDGTERTVYFDDRKAEEPTIHGHSNGRWEGEVLVIETTSFSDHRMGNSFSLPSSNQKHLVERLELNADGKSLQYSFELTDAEYLAEPLIGQTTWAYRPDVKFTSVECDLENSRMYLDE